MTQGKYEPPFRYFGGKSQAADIVWSAIGDVTHYIEPFFGSGATLFLRPGGAGRVETVNDADCMIANFFRSLQRNPDTVAEHADLPVNEADLCAVQIWLVGQRESITRRLMADPDFHDAKAAGWWAWGINNWVGGEWCSGEGPWVAQGGVLICRERWDGKTPRDPGIKMKRPHLMTTGCGVNRRMPHDPCDERGECGARREWLKSYLRGLADRLRNVRVCCGDWSRICAPSITKAFSPVGVFLDPPYSQIAARDNDIYVHGSFDIAKDVREWALENGSHEDMRIVLAGYDGEHEMPSDWRVVSWMPHGGYGLMGGDDNKGGRANRVRERLWMSPHCLNQMRQNLL